MLNDCNVINDYNPFVVGEFNLPGTWSASWPYSKHTIHKDPIDKAIEPSPICSYGVTAAIGSFLRGGSFCDPPYKKEPVISCPMSRDVEPQQLFDDGRWSLSTPTPTPKPIPTVPLYLVIILLLLILRKIF